MSEHHTGLLIIRAWREPGSTRPLRARIRVVDDLATGAGRTLTLTDSKSVGGLVDRWLSDLPESTEP